MTLDSIAELGRKGRAAGPAVLKCLDSPDPEVRVAATAALGCIQYEAAIPDLIRVLNSSETWKQCYAAAESLGRLKASEALPVLKEVESSHWYPPVRESARKAISVITGKSEYDPSGEAGGLDYLPFYGEERKELREFSASEVNALADRLRKRDESLIPAERLATMPELGGDVMEGPPQTGIEVEDGSIVGADFGEWGGELAFVGAGGRKASLANRNVHAIHRLGDQILAVTGLAHLGTNWGYAERVIRGADGKWRAEHWRTLPGAPCSSWITGDGRLFVNTTGGAVLVSPDGKMELVKRPL